MNKIQHILTFLLRLLISSIYYIASGERYDVMTNIKLDASISSVLNQSQVAALTQCAVLCQEQSWCSNANAEVISGRDQNLLRCSLIEGGIVWGTGDLLAADGWSVLATDACAFTECQNASRCTFNADVSYTCHCENGYGGNRCQVLCDAVVDDACFAVTTSPMSWEDNVLHCEAIGGRIAEIHTSEVNQALKQLCVDHEQQLWIGGNDLDIEGHFVWATSGTELSLTDWVPDDPGNSNGGEHCVALYFPENGLWVDAICSISYSAICEYGI